MRTVVVIFILALITIAGEIYSGAALTSGKASHTAAPDLATQLSRMGSNTGKWPMKAARKSGGLFDLWTHAIGGRETKGLTKMR
jgi:hypothetical protein